MDRSEFPNTLCTGLHGEVCGSPLDSFDGTAWMDPPKKTQDICWDVKPFVSRETKLSRIFAFA